MANENSRLELIARISEKLQKGPHALVVLNIDRFRLINHKYGYDIGDALLQTVEQRAQDQFTQALVMRLWGDEFAIVIPLRDGKNDLETVAQRTMSLFKTPFYFGGEKLRVSASIGVSAYPRDFEDVNALINHAEQAMVSVKQGGKNGFMVYGANAPSFTSLTEKDILAALQAGEFEMYYQPVVEGYSSKIVGAEALMRWNHPHHGRLAASEFMSFLEDSELVRVFVDWMIATVCSDISWCRKQGILLRRVAINVSPQYFEKWDFFSTLKNALERHNIPGSRIAVEIAENVFLRNSERALKQISRLSEYGISVVIDDFGMAYSPTSYLHHYAVDTIKIDRLFVSYVNASEGNYPVISGILSIAQKLGLNVIAEGVETPEQVDYLLKQGCSLMQGYLFHRPMPLTDMVRVLQSEQHADNAEA